MSIKKLFEDSRKSNNILAETTKKTSFDDAESAVNVSNKQASIDRHVPQVDYSEPANFVKFGSARLYYESAFTRILDFYPYDGSEAEINKFHNESLDIEKYIFDKKYPRTNGFITLARDGYSVSSKTTDGYGVPTTNEFIDFKGGPGTGSATSLKLKDLLPNPYSSKYNSSNIYDENIYQTEGLPSDYGSGTRASNLRANFDDGVTVEFWMRTGSFSNTTDKQVVFDMWNQNASSTNDYGRIMVELTSSTSHTDESQRPFLITVQSGAHTTKDFLSLGAATLHDSMETFNHYAIRIYNTGSSLTAQLFVNGEYSDEAARIAYDLSSSNTVAARAWPHAEQAHYSSSANLQGWWRLNKDVSSTGTVTDSSGNGRTGLFDTDDDGTDDRARPSFTTTQLPSKYVQARDDGGTEGSCDFSSDETNSISIGSAATWDAIIGNDTCGCST